MHSLTLLYFRFRWLHVPGALLVFLLQRTPLVRAVVSTEFVLTSSISSVLKGTLGVVAAMGAVQTVAGATEIDPAPGADGNPANGTVGEPFTGGFAVVGAPAVAASYQITGTIPEGLTVSGLTGDTVNASVVTITGTPTVAGNFDLTVRAWKGPNKTDLGGTPSFTYSIHIGAAAGTAPSFTTQPVSQTVDEGANVNFTAAASGDPTPTFQWRKDGVNIGGATAATLSLTSVGTTDAGSYTVVATNSEGSATSNAATLTVNQVSSGELTVVQQPSSRDVDAGASVTLSVGVSTATGNTYQWFFHRSGLPAPQAISGATSATYTDSNVQASDMGAYFVRVTNGTQSVDSQAVLVTLSGGSSRLANLSTRGRIAAGGELKPGFVLGGTGNKQLLVRSIGPTLTAPPFNQQGYISDPFMEVIPLGGSTAVESSDNWGDESNPAAIRDTASAVGAFALLEGSADATLLKSLPLPNAAGTKGYSVRMVNRVAGESGLAIAEVYDPDLTSSQRLVNVSALGFSGNGADALVPGFVISGTAAKTMLIRVVGPSLTDFGVTGVMADPRLSVIPISQNFVVASNDNWGGTPELKAAFASTGAFSLQSDASLDAVVLVRLPPGGYSVVVKGANDTTGNVIVEAYEVD